MHFKHIVLGFGMAAFALANISPMTAAPSATSRAAMIEVRNEPIVTAVAGHCEQFDGVPVTDSSGSVSRVSQGQVICDSWTSGYYMTRGTPSVNVFTTTFVTTVPAKPTQSVTVYTTTFPVTIAKPTPSVTIYTTTFPTTIAKPTPTVTVYTTTYPSTVLITPSPSVHVYTTTLPTTIVVSPTSSVHTITTTLPVTFTTTSPSVQVHTTTLHSFVTITPRALPTVSSLNERCNVDELGQTYCVKEERFAKTMATQMTIDMATVNRDAKALETSWIATQPLDTSAFWTGKRAPIATWKNPPADYPLVIDYRPATTNQDEHEQGIEQEDALAFGIIVPVNERMAPSDEGMRIEVVPGIIVSTSDSTRVSINGWAYWAALGALSVRLGLL